MIREQLQRLVSLSIWTNLLPVSSYSVPTVYIILYMYIYRARSGHDCVSHFYATPFNSRSLSHILDHVLIVWIYILSAFHCL